MKKIILIKIMGAILLISCHNQEVEKNLIQDVKNRDIQIDKDLAKRWQTQRAIDNITKANNLKNAVKREQIHKSQLLKQNVKLDILNFKDGISLEFNKVDIKQTLRSLLRLQNKDVTFDDSISDKKISISFKNIPWIDAFKTILNNNNLVLDPNSNKIISIHTQQSFSKLLQYEQNQLLEKINNRIKVQKIENTKKTLNEAIQFDKFNVFYADIEQLSSQIKTMFAAEYMTENQPIIAIDQFSNSLLIRGSKSQLDIADKLIKTLDVKDKQVLIEVIIVAVGNDFDFQLGSQLSLLSNNVRQISEDGTVSNENNKFKSNLGLGNNVSISVIENIGLGQLKIALDALERKEISRTLSNPKVLAKNNKAATFIQGTQFQITTTTITSDGVIHKNIEYKDANLQVKITPKISPDGFVLMDISVTNDELKSDGVTIDKMQINTSLLVENNKIASIGGLFLSKQSNVSSKTPLFGDIPILGNLFKQKKTEDNQSELLVFISPKIL